MSWQGKIIWRWHPRFVILNCCAYVWPRKNIGHIFTISNTGTHAISVYYPDARVSQSHLIQLSLAGIKEWFMLSLDRRHEINFGSVFFGWSGNKLRYFKLWWFIVNPRIFHITYYTRNNKKVTRHSKEIAETGRFEKHFCSTLCSGSVSVSSEQLTSAPKTIWTI